MNTKRGFALLTPEKVRELAQRGGREAQKRGTAHIFTTEEAKIAGRKGGKAPHPKQRQSDREA
jgi:general stress protein YciG